MCRLVPASDVNWLAAGGTDAGVENMQWRRSTSWRLWDVLPPSLRPWRQAEEVPMAVDVTATASIDRPREAVAAYLRDPANDTSWIGGVRSARLLTPGPVRAGSQVARVAGFLGRRMEYVNEVTELTCDRLAMRSVRSPRTSRCSRAATAFASPPREARRGSTTSCRCAQGPVEAVRADDRDDRLQEPPRTGERAPGSPREVIRPALV